MRWRHGASIALSPLTMWKSGNYWSLVKMDSALKCAISTTDFADFTAFSAQLDFRG